MKKISALFLLLLFLFSCNTPNEELGEFEILPLPQKFEITGVSTLNVSNLKKYHSILNPQLLVENNLFSRMKKTDKASKAQLQFGIDTTLNIKGQGYTMQINRDQIKITGKDPVGLFYGFKTLDQLLIDAEEQNPFYSSESYKPTFG